jgi:hypothetical protein
MSPISPSAGSIAHALVMQLQCNSRERSAATMQLQCNYSATAMQKTNEHEPAKTKHKPK